MKRIRRTTRPWQCRSMLGALYLAVVLATTSLWAADAPLTTAASRGESDPSLTEINKKITNPVSDLWSIAFQQNNFILDMGAGQSERWNSNLNFQPVLPVALTSNSKCLTRPVITVCNSVPHPDPNNPGDVERTTGFGDTVLMELLSPSPKLAGNWLLGLGPTFIFPTASSDFTGQGKWQVGPAALVGYLAKKWILGALFQELDIFGRYWKSGREPDESSAYRSLFFTRWLEYRIQWQHPGELEGRQGGRYLDHPPWAGRLQSCEVRQASSQVRPWGTVYGTSPGHLRPEMEHPAHGGPCLAEAHQGKPDKIMECWSGGEWSNGKIGELE